MNPTELPHLQKEWDRYSNLMSTEAFHNYSLITINQLVRTSKDDEKEKLLRQQIVHRMDLLPLSAIFSEVGF